jgi:hypothetical protein
MLRGKPAPLSRIVVAGPRRELLRQALAAGGLPDSTDLDVLTSMLIGSPDRVLSAVWPVHVGLPYQTSRTALPHA